MDGREFAQAPGLVMDGEAWRRLSGCWAAALCYAVSRGSFLPPSEDSSLHHVPGKCGVLGDMAGRARGRCGADRGQGLLGVLPPALKPWAGVPLVERHRGSMGSTHLPSVTARGPASSAPRRPPRGYRDTMSDHTSRTRWSGSGWPVRIRHVSLVNS